MPVSYHATFLRNNHKIQKVSLGKRIQGMNQNWWLKNHGAKTRTTAALRTPRPPPPPPAPIQLFFKENDTQ